MCLDSHADLLVADFCYWLLPAFVQQSLGAKIVPLRSTRADVERILGKATRSDDIDELDEGTVQPRVWRLGLPERDGTFANVFRGVDLQR